MAADGQEQRTADAAERADLEWREAVFRDHEDELSRTLIDIARTPAESALIWDAEIARQVRDAYEAVSR